MLVVGDVRLSESSLDCDPIQRLREAQRNIWYILEDLPRNLADSDWVAHRRHHLAVTPVHEAAHAVASALSGRRQKDVRVFLLRRRDGTGGMSRAYGPMRQTPKEALAALGAHGMAREVVSIFAGPIAELRFDARLVYSGSRADAARAEAICKAASYLEVGDRYDWQSRAWIEACRMFSDERVWQATLEIAGRLKRSCALDVATVGGPTIHRIVDEYLPDGWHWTGIFAEPLEKSAHDDIGRGAATKRAR